MYTNIQRWNAFSLEIIFPTTKGRSMFHYLPLIVSIVGSAASLHNSLPLLLWKHNVTQDQSTVKLHFLKLFMKCQNFNLKKNYSIEVFFLKFITVHFYIILFKSRISLNFSVYNPYMVRIFIGLLKITFKIYIGNFLIAPKNF